MALINPVGCNFCELRKEWKFLVSPKMKFTPPKENSELRILFLGEGPGRVEDEKGKQFVGPTGQYLRDCIPTKWKNKLYWQNSVRCRPPRNRTPEKQEVECCSIYLTKDILEIRPHVIVGVGEVALNCFWPEQSISKIRGIPFPVTIDKQHTCWFYPIFHSSYVMRADQKDEPNPIYPIFYNDLKKFFDNLDRYSTPPATIELPKDIKYPTTKEETVNLFNQLKDPYVVDLETHRLKPYMEGARILMASFSDGDLTFSFPIDWPGHFSSWGKETFNQLIQSKRTWIAQNAAFEYCWIWNFTSNPYHNFEDVQALARLYHQRKGINGLASLSRIYLGFDVKKITNVDSKRLLVYPIEQVLEYNALDSWSEAVIYKQLISLLASDQFDNYYRILETIKSTVAMELAGLTVDLKESEKLNQELTTKCNEFEQQAKLLPEVKKYEAKERKPFSISAPATVGLVLVDYCDISLPQSDNGIYSTDDSYLEKLVGRHALVDLTRSWREVNKLRSTYVEPILSGKYAAIDRLLHSAYNVLVTATYRLSSEDPNIQNFPKRKHREIRRQIIAPKGFLLASFDYGQLEVRLLAMASKDKNLAKAFFEKEDIHSKWLNRVVEIYPPYLDRLAEKTGETDEKKIRKSGRDIIKSDFVFALFYGSLPESVASRTGLPSKEAFEVCAEFWKEYNDVKSWMDNQFKIYQDTGLVTSLTNRIRNEVLWGNEPLNTAIQGTAGEVVLEAQNALFIKALKEDINLLPRINIHDDLIFILPDDNDLERYIPFIAKEIVKPRFPFVTVPLMTECKVGYNWCDLEEIGKWEGQVYAQAM